MDCPPIDSIIKEANEVAGEVEHESVLDAALIAAAQAVEHYEITRYGTLISWANHWATGIVSRCQENLDQDKDNQQKRQQWPNVS